MLDVVEKDPMTPAVPTERASSWEKKSEHREEEPTDLPAPMDSKLQSLWDCPFRRISLHMEETANGTPWIHQFMGRWVWPTPLEEADSPVNIPLRA